MGESLARPCPSPTADSWTLQSRAENWSDALLLILICFYLYQLVKGEAHYKHALIMQLTLLQVPWDMYYASHGRVVLSSTEPKEGEPGFDPVLAAQRNESVRALKKVELVSLLMTCVVPVVGSFALYWVRRLLSDPEKYINGFVIGVFGMTTSIKPLLHLASLYKRRESSHLCSERSTELTLLSSDALFHQE